MLYPRRPDSFGIAIFVMAVLFVIFILARSWVSTHIEPVVESRSQEEMVVQEFYGNVNE